VAREIAPALRAALAAGAILACAAVRAGEPLTIALNWTPNAQHAPLYFARAQGWYAAAGVDLAIEPVLGSPAAIERVSTQRAALAVSDFVAWLRAAADGAPGAAVLALEDGSPYALYFDRTRTTQPPGGRVASQARDPMRALWPVVAARRGLDPAPQWVDLINRDKPEALARGDVDGALNAFLHNHLAYVAALGERLGVLWWRELGFDAYGLVLVASKPAMERTPELLARFVEVTQRAWTRCRVAPAPCIEALRAAQPDLEAGHELALWRLAQPAPTGAFDGRFEPARVRRTYADVEAGFGMHAPADPVTTDRFLTTTTPRDPR
jgi:NitT/TauT family transport system substrate-binding protein